MSEKSHLHEVHIHLWSAVWEMIYVKSVSTWKIATAQSTPQQKMHDSIESYND